MKKKNWLILLSCTLLLGGWLLYPFAPSSRAPKIATLPVADKAADKMPMEFAGLTVSSYAKGELQSRVKIKSLRTAPRKITVFQVKSLDELVLIDVSSEIFQGAAEPSDLLPLGEMQKQFNGGEVLKGMGRITQARMLKLSATFTRAGKETLRLDAQEGTLDFRNRHTVLQKVSLFQPASQRRITSDRIDWDRVTRRFIIPGAYQERSGDKILRGSGVSVGTDFSVSPLPQQKQRK